MKMGVNFKKRIFLTIFCNTHPSWNNLLWNANSPFSTSEINETHFLCQKSFWIYFNILLFFGLPISIWSKFEFFLLQEIKIFLSSEFPISNGVFQICCSPIQFLGSNFEIIDEISWHGSNMSSFLRNAQILAAIWILLKRPPFAVWPGPHIEIKSHEIIGVFCKMRRPGIEPVIPRTAARRLIHSAISADGKLIKKSYFWMFTVFVWLIVPKINFLCTSTFIYILGIYFDF